MNFPLDTQNPDRPIHVSVCPAAWADGIDAREQYLIRSGRCPGRGARRRSQAGPKDTSEGREREKERERERERERRARGCGSGGTTHAEVEEEEEDHQASVASGGGRERLGSSITGGQPGTAQSRRRSPKHTSRRKRGWACWG